MNANWVTRLSPCRCARAWTTCADAQLYVRENHIAYSNMSFSYVREAIAASLATLNTALCRVRRNSPLTDATPADSDESQHPRTTTPKEACTGSSVSKRITAPGDLFVPLRDIHLAKSGVGWNGQLQLLYSQDTRFYIFTAPKRVPFCFIWRLARRSGLSLRTLHGHGGMDRHRTTN